MVKVKRPAPRRAPPSPYPPQSRWRALAHGRHLLRFIELPREDVVPLIALERTMNYCRFLSYFLCPSHRLLPTFLLSELPFAIAWAGITISIAAITAATVNNITMRVLLFSRRSAQPRLVAFCTLIVTV